jgi:site-specific DNA-methyltransferase (adenine-specific)
MPKPQYKTQAKPYQLFLADCLEKLRELPENSVDSVVTDPPYGLKFMSKKWDYTIPDVEVWKECLRVLKPGGFLLSFGGCRTYHRLVCNIEDAGFTIHPLIAWIYGSGFPKATNLSKNIDKAAGAKRRVVGSRKKLQSYGTNADGIVNEVYGGGPDKEGVQEITAPATKAAKQWDGWFYGLQALKPAIEPICMAQKPYEGKPVDSILKWGCGALNINSCKVEIPDEDFKGKGGGGIHPRTNKQRVPYDGGYKERSEVDHSTGRWPANLILSHHPECVKVGVKKVKGTHAYGPKGSANKSSSKSVRENEVYGKDNTSRFITGHVDSKGLETVEDWECHPDCPIGMFPKTKPSKAGPRGGTNPNPMDWGNDRSDGQIVKGHTDSGGSAARFFYCAKASKRDRNEGLERFEEKEAKSTNWSGERKEPMKKNSHPTVKPTDLMKYLCRLITPPGGIILDPFMGSGSTGKACMLEGFRFMGIEIDYEYFKIARERIKHATKRRS